MRRLLIPLLLILLITWSQAQKSSQHEIYFTAVHTDGSPVERLSPSELEVPDGVQITNVEKIAEGPIRFGLLLDNTGSRRKILRGQIELAYLLVDELLRDEKDSGFVVNFNETPYLDQDFTKDKSLLKKAAARGQARGGSALFDAVDAASDHLEKDIVSSPAVLLLVSDGEDNASKWGESQALAKLQTSGVRVYGFRLGGEGSPNQFQRGLRILDDLASTSGGRSFNLQGGATISVKDPILTLKGDMQNWFRATYIVKKESKKGFRIKSGVSSVVIASPLLSTRKR